MIKSGACYDPKVVLVNKLGIHEKCQPDANICYI